MAASVGAAFVGWILANRAYSKAGKGYSEPINAAAPALYTTLFNKWYVDETYDYLFTGRRKVDGVRLGVMGLGDALKTFDVDVIDGGVNGAGWLTRSVATLSRLWDTYIIDGVLVNGPAVVTKMFSYPVRLLEWGLVQWYALVMVLGLAGFTAYYVFHWTGY
jgi:NADH-quinone oxidoreductase subunit L